MLDRPSIVCRVLRPITSPIVARRDEILAVWFGHPTHAVCVLDPEGEEIIRHAPRDEGLLYGELLEQFLDARIRLPEASQRALLSRSA